MGKEKHKKSDVRKEIIFNPGRIYADKKICRRPPVIRCKILFIKRYCLLYKEII